MKPGMRAPTGIGSTGLMAAALAAALASWHCSNEPLAGGTIETTNGIVAGKVEKPGGEAAARTLVRLIPEDYDPVRDTAAPAFDTTDAEGRFTFSHVGGGRYNILSVQGEDRTRALATGIRVANDTVSVDPLVLGIPGSIQVHFGEDGFSREGYVYVPGTGIAASLDGLSKVILDSVPSGLIAAIRYASGASATPAVLRYAIPVFPGDTALVANPGWKYRKTLRLNTSAAGAPIGADVRDFPALVRLNRDNFDFATAAADGRDVRFTKADGQALSHEIESWDAAALQAQIWVRVDTVHAGNPGQTLSLYAGNPAAISASRSETVFDTAAGFQGVWHLGGSGTDTVYDATGNHFDGTAYGMSAASRVAGPVGPARRFDGATSFIQIPGSASGKLDFPEGAAYTLSAWVAVDSATHRPELIVGKGHSQYYLRKNYYTAAAYWELVEYRDAQKQIHICEAPAAPTAWKYLVGVSQGDSQSLYLDGELVMDTTRQYPFNGGITARNSGFDVTIGKHLQGTPQEGDGFLKGSLDEIRISNTAYDADRIKLEYLNQKPDAAWVEFP